MLDGGSNPPSSTICIKRSLKIFGMTFIVLGNKTPMRLAATSDGIILPGDPDLVQMMGLTLESIA